MRALTYIKFFQQIFGILILMGIYINGKSQETLKPTSSNLAPIEMTRKAAEMVCHLSYGNFPIYDIESYFDTDKERSCDVYIFNKNDRWLQKKNILIDSIRIYRQLYYNYSDSIKNIYNYFPNSPQIEKKLYFFRKQLNKYLHLSSRPMDFVTIYTSASNNHIPVFEYREGLPESYVLLYDIGRMAHNMKLDISEGVDFYYFGILRIFIAEKNSSHRHFISLFNQNVQIDESQMGNYKFNLESVEKDYLIKTEDLWGKVRKKVSGSIDNTNFLDETSSGPIIVPDVPYFRQDQWLNVLPNQNSCAIMSAASVLSHYDPDYWDITPYAEYSPPPDRANAGFEQPLTGTNYIGMIPPKLNKSIDIKFGPETLLYDLAIALGYDFSGGGTPYNCAITTRNFQYAAYTNAKLNWNFTYHEAGRFPCGPQGHPYDEIKIEINNSRPMTLGGLEYFNWQGGGGPYGQEGPHEVALVGYDETNQNGVSGNAIGVYTNGWTDYEVIWWNYDQIRSQNNIFTLKSQSGGDSGVKINAPSLITPINNVNVPPGNIYFSWENIGATRYRVQISSNSSFIHDENSVLYNEYNNVYTNPTNISKSIIIPGKYYWRAAGQNSNHHWCNFSNTGSFIIAEPLLINIIGGNTTVPFCWGSTPSTTLTALASGGAPPYIYSWLGGTTTVIENGLYSCSVTDSEGITVSSTVIVLFIPIACAIDPNSITGPNGFSEKKWVSVNDKLTYTINFENDPDFATAPAQEIRVKVPVSDKANMYSLRIGDFGFGNYVFSVPPNTSFYTKRLDLSDSLGICLDVMAGLDVNTQEAFWNFTSIDPATGLPPNDPQTGFLPVNDSLTHNGEGYVSFFMSPLITDATGDILPATAEIIFDINEPINTNTWENMVDALPPSSAVDPLPPLMDTTSFDISFSGQDDPDGCGISKFKLYFSKNSGPYNLFGEYVVGEEAHFTGILNSAYEFFSIATDHVGNTEPMKTVPDAYTVLGNTNIQASSIVFSNIWPEAFNLNWTDGNGLKRVVFVKQDTVSAAIPANNNTYTANTVFGSGTQIGSSGWFCVFNGNVHPNGVTVTNLQPDTKYRVMVCEYIGSPGAEHYNSVTATGNPGNQKTCSVVIPVISGLTELCAGSTDITYSTEPGMMDYSWNISAGGAITAGAGTQSVAVSWNTAGEQTISVNYSNSEGCTAVSATVKNITIHPAPLPVLAGPSTACLREGYNLSYYYSTEPGMTGYSWNISAGGVITSGEGTNAIEVNWNTPGPQYVSVTYANSYGCNTPSPTQYIVIVDSVTVPGTVTGGTYITLGSPTDTLVLTGHRGTVLVWQKVHGAEEPFTDIPATQGLLKYVEIPASAGTWKYRAVVQNDSCFAEYSESTSVVVARIPIARSWTGVIDEKWNKAGNWSPVGIPGPDDDVLIPQNVPHMPEVKVQGLSCHKVTLEQGATLDIKNGVTLTINGVELRK